MEKELFFINLASGISRIRRANKTPQSITDKGSFLYSFFSLNSYKSPQKCIDIYPPNIQCLFILIEHGTSSSVI